MRRTLCISLLALLTGAGPASAEDPPPLRAALSACATGPAALDRFAEFTGSMPARVGTHRMRMRFVLLARGRGERRWRRVRAAAFGRWERSEPGRSGFVYTKRVDGLTPRTSYRAVVRFKWVDAAGAVQGRARRVTRRCRPAEVRPDLRVLGVEVLGAGRYRATIVNDGRSALTRAVDVVLTVAGAAQPARQLSSLAPGQRVVLDLHGPACPAGAAVSVAVDPGDLVDEAEEDDNVLGRPCEA